MTVDEFMDWLYASPDTEPCDEDIRARLQALIYTESKRAAGVCHTQRNNTTVIGRLLALWRDACECCRDEILRTSPGKGGG